MSLKAKIMGLYNSAMGVVIRLIIAAVAAVVLWFGSEFVVDYLLNFLATGDHNGRQEIKYHSDDPMFLAIRGVICVVAFIFLAKGKKR